MEISLHWNEQELNEYVALWQIGKTKYICKKLDAINASIDDIQNCINEIKYVLPRYNTLKSKHEWHKARGRNEMYLTGIQNYKEVIQGFEHDIDICMQIIDNIDDDSKFKSFYKYVMGY